MTIENDAPPTPTVYTMRLDFDVRQVSTALRFNLLGNEGPDPTSVQPEGTPAMQTSGVAAGGYQLQNGNGINVAIYASYDPDTTSNITIMGLTLVSLPAPYSAHYKLPDREQPHLSPCDSDYATCHFNFWQPNYPTTSGGAALDQPPTSPTPFTTSQSFNPPQPPLLGPLLEASGAPDGSMNNGGTASNLTICAESGLWQIMGFLSVLVKTKKSKDSEEEVQTHRVYTFDPTLMVGDGSLPR